MLIIALACLMALWAINRANALEDSPASWNRDKPGSLPSHSRYRAALPMLIMLAAVQIWVAIQWLGGISRDGGETFQQLLLGIAYCMAFWLTIELFSTRRQLTLLLTVIVLCGTFQAFYGTFMALSGIDWLLFEAKSHNRGLVTGTFVNRNHLAGYLEMALACGVGLMLTGRGASRFSWQDTVGALLSRKFVIRLSLVIMVIGLVMSRSRMGNTAFFSSLIIVGALFIIFHRENRLRNSLILASLIAIDVLIISQYFGLERLKDRLVATQLEDRVVAGEVVRRENVDRDDVAKHVAKMIAEKPLAGYGAGSFESAFHRHAGADLQLDFDHAHNDYLEFVAELGITGSLPLAGFALLAIYHALRGMRHRQSSYRRGVATGAVMGLLALLIHSLTDFNLRIPANGMLFVVLAAIAVLANSHTAERRS